MSCHLNGVRKSTGAWRLPSAETGGTGCVVPWRALVTTYICVRKTLDWGEAAAVERGLLPHLRPKVRVWDETFNLPYRVFRQRLKEIAHSNLEQVTNAVVAPLHEIPDGALVLPVDDDDWFAPDVADGLRAEFDPAVPCYLWRHYTIELPRPWRERAQLAVWRLKGGRSLTCNTNNYAVTRSPEREPAILGHGKASRYFDAHPEQVKRIPARWNVQFRNMSSKSIGKRRPEVTRAELLERLHAYRRLHRRLRLPPALSWAKPYVDRTAALLAELEVRA